MLVETDSFFKGLKPVMTETNSTKTDALWPVLWLFAVMDSPRKGKSVMMEIQKTPMGASPLV